MHNLSDLQQTVIKTNNFAPDRTCNMVTRVVYNHIPLTYGVYKFYQPPIFAIVCILTWEMKEFSTAIAMPNNAIRKFLELVNGAFNVGLRLNINHFPDICVFLSIWMKIVGYFHCYLDMETISINCWNQIN